MTKKLYEDSGTVVQEQNWKCNAHGCQLPGGMSKGFGSESKYYCRFHYGREWHENDAITAVLRPFFPIFNSVSRMRTSQDTTAMNNYFQTHGFDTLQATQQEIQCSDTYRNRLVKDLNTMVFSEIKKAKENV